MTQGKAFVLFTSYQTMQKLAESLASFFRSEKIACLVQGGSLPRHRLLQKFKDDRDSVLFGTDSFWQGVDCAGRGAQQRHSHAASVRRAGPSADPGQSANGSSRRAATRSASSRCLRRS